MARTGWAWVALAVALGCAASAASGAPTSQSVRFTAVGDFNANSDTAAVLDGIAAAQPDAMFALGDLSYSATATPTEDLWCDFVKARVGEGFPFELLAGNHESNGQDGDINDFSACLPNQLPGLVGTYGRQYHVDVPQVDPLVRYVMISPDLTFPDGTWSYAPGTPRYAWTRGAIDQARARGIPWVVVGMHKPCLSRGQYTCPTAVTGLVDLLVNRRVDLVLMGHEHHYERTHQLALGPGCPALAVGTFDADCVVDADGEHAAGAGTVFLTLGTGGVNLRNINLADSEAGYFADGTGANTTSTHGFGDFAVTPDRLDFSFVRASGGAYSDAFSLVRGAAPANNPPTAAFDATQAGFVVTVDASESGDTDGDITSYSWDWGDSTGGSGVTTQHTYAVAGTYPVTLTVTDDDGATGVLTQEVSVGAPSTVAFAADDFERLQANGWGPADTGGSWTTTGRVGETSVSGGEGRLTMSAPGRQPTATLPQMTPTADLDLTYDLGFSRRPSSRVDTTARLRIGSAGTYTAMVRLQPNGAVRTGVYRTPNGSPSVALGPVVTVPGLTYDVGDVLAVRAQATGTSPTTLRVKVWEQGTPEPATWSSTAQDSTAGYQAPGVVGLRAYLSSTDNNAPLTATFDDLRAVSATSQP